MSNMCKSRALTLLHNFFKSLLFMRAEENGSGGSLSGNKKDVYIFLKIMKLMFGVSLTSFYLKYAIDRALGKGFT